MGSSTYPSVYVAFQTLLATDLCGVVGTAINSVTTIGFDVNELSTAASYYIDSYIGDPGELLTTQSWYTYSAMDWQNRYVILPSYPIVIAKNNDVSQHGMYRYRNVILDVRF